MRRITLIRLSIIIFLTISLIIPIIAYPKRSINVINESIEIQSSSSYEYEWLVTYGKEGIDRGYGIIMDSLGNIYVSGFLDGAGPLCLLKYNYNGSLLWNKTWGQGEGCDIVMNDTNSIYVTGCSAGQICLLKYNSSGDLLLNKTWGSSAFEAGNGIDIDNLGNIYITGKNDDVLILLKYNASGHLEWNKSLEVHSEGNDIVVDEIGNIYITGYKQNGLNQLDLCILKYNSSGNLEWEDMWGGPEYDCGSGIALGGVGNIYITGYGVVGLGDLDLYILKYNSSGNLEWVTKWGGDEIDFGYDIKLDNFGNIYITGATGSFKKHSNIPDILLAKFDKNGNNLGFKTWGYIVF